MRQVQLAQPDRWGPWIPYEAFAVLVEPIRLIAPLFSQHHSQFAGATLQKTTVGELFANNNSQGRAPSQPFRGAETHRETSLRLAHWRTYALNRA